MKISCPSCSAKYSIADEKVQNRLAKIRCRKCGTSIVIDGNVTPANVYAAEASPDAGSPADDPLETAEVSGAATASSLGTGTASSSASRGTATASGGTVYTVDFGEGDQRQMSVSELVSAYNAGTVNAQTYLWAEGFADWVPLGEVSDVVSALHAAAQGGAIPEDSNAAAALSTTPDETPWSASGSQASASSGADLFGSYDQAGSEQEVTTSASAGVGRVAANPFAQPPAAAATGARNESSVLFSLSALTSAATSSKPSVPAPSASSSDDSGLIDLRALTAAAEAKAPAAPAAPIAAPLPLGGVSPLGAPVGGLGSPLGVAQAQSPVISAPQKSNTGLFIIGGSIIVAAIAVAAIVVLGGKADPVAPPAPTPAPAPVVAAPAPTTDPLPAAPSTSLPAAEAKPPATGTETEEPAPTTAPKKTTTTSSTPKKTTTSGSSSSSSSSSSGTSSTPAATPKPAAAPAKSKCGCAANDLMCNMKCSSK